MRTLAELGSDVAADIIRVILDVDFSRVTVSPARCAGADAVTDGASARMETARQNASIGAESGARKLSGILCTAIEE